MTKKHFIALADFIRCNGGFSRRQKLALAEFCKSQNGAFKRELWLAYVEGKCGPRGGRPR